MRMNSPSSAALSGLPGNNLNLIATLLRDSIVHLCKVSKIYDGSIEIDGIICISGKVEGQQLVVKVHESFRPQDVGRKGKVNDSIGDNCGFGYKDERSIACDGNSRYSSNERKRKRLDSRSETARSSSDVWQYDRQQEIAGLSRSFESDYRNGIKDMSMKKQSASGLNCSDLMVGENNPGSGANNTSSNTSPYAVSSATVAYQVDEVQVSYNGPRVHLGNSLFRPRSLGMNGERWNNSRVLPECRLCGCGLESSEALSDHNEAVHSLFTCLCCFKTFTSRSNLERHSRLHTGHKPYLCTICGKAFSRKDHLSNHATKHAFKCGTCSKRYADRSSLISHYHLEHCAALTNICAYCNKGFSSQEAFEDHVKIHPQFHLAVSGEPDETAVDEKHEATSQFTDKGQPKPNSLLAFYKHRSLTDYSLYTCLVCNRSFDHPWKYSCHLSVHPDETNIFRCCMCLQVCDTLTHLRQHEAEHFSKLSDFLTSAGLRSYSCSSCDQSFDSAHRFRAHLEEHQRMKPVHLEERQRMNPVDEEEHRRLRHLKLHQEAQEHKSMDFSCGLCDARFADQSSLLRHLEENDHDPASDEDSKALKRGKRKQTRPKLAVAVQEKVNEDSDVEVVEPESLKPLSLQRGRSTPEGFDHAQAEQTTEDAKRNDEVKIRSDPIRSLISSRSLMLAQSDREHQNSSSGSYGVESTGISKETSGTEPSLVSHERADECSVTGEVTKDEPHTTYLHDSPYKFSFGSLMSDGCQYPESYRSLKRCLSAEGCHCASTPSDPVCLNNNVSSLRNENSTCIPSGPPFLCAFCDSKMETFSELDAHCQVEHSRSPCMFCAKTFAQKANRDRHHCLHTGDRPYGCPECEERFSRGDKLKMHRVRMHGIQYPAYSSRQRDAASCREYSASSSPGSYSYEAFGQHVAFLGHPPPLGSLDLHGHEEGSNRREKGVLPQGDCSEEEQNQVLDRQMIVHQPDQTTDMVPVDLVRSNTSS